MFLLREHLGSVRSVVSETGAVQQRNNYFPYGDIFPSTSNDDSGNRYKYTGKESGDEIGLYDFSARFLHTRFGRFTTIDPLAEKYPGISPYAYCNGNPVNFVDPDGMDIYRYDDKSGTFHLYQKNDDEYDQIAKFKKNKDTGEYVLKSKRNGNAKLRIGNIEKGILSDGINLLEDSQVWSTDDVSIEGFQDFIVQYSDMIGREMGGYYYTEIGGTDLKYINSGKGKNNTHTMSYPGAGIFRVRRDLYGKVEVHTNWHTHPSNAENKLKPSPQDYSFKYNHSQNGVRRFIILTGGHPPFEY